MLSKHIKYMYLFRVILSTTSKINICRFLFQNVTFLVVHRVRKMAQFKFRGHIAPTFTPFNSDKTINLDVIPTYAKYLSNNGINGLLINGTSGEGTSMSVKERKLVTEHWFKARTQKQVLMVQVGGAPLPDVIELAKHADSLGVDALLCLPELYMKPKNADELIEYLAIVGEAAPNTPLFYYHVPMFSSVNINMVDFLNMADGKIPTLAGMKFTSTDLVEGLGCVKACNGKYLIFLGADQILAAAYTLGFNSAIATTFNIFPKIGNNILQHFKNDEINVELARKEQQTLTDYINRIIKHGSWVATMKAAMNLLTPINVGPVREPMWSLSQKQIDEINAAFTD